jgi:hypothetical protein
MADKAREGFERRPDRGNQSGAGSQPEMPAEGDACAVPEQRSGK